MKLRTLIIDDEPIALAKLKSYVEKTPFLTLAGMCNSALEASAMLADENVDLIVTDINMPDLNGLEFVETLTSRPLIIFTTAYSDYAVDSYRLAATDYLVKPYGFADFQRAANRAREQHASQKTASTNNSPITPHEPSLFIKTDSRYIRVNLTDICYVKGYGEYLQVFIAGIKHPLLTLSSFASFKTHLSENFIQVHRSYIVNMNHVDHIERNRITMDAETIIPIGDSYRQALSDYLTKHSTGQATR